MTDVLIRQFQPGDELAFRSLNEEWIKRHFGMEPKDEQTFADPGRTILRNGGQILFATLDGRCVGCCALLRSQPDEFEVGKMAVAPECRGTGIGRKLLQAVIESARESGARCLFLETNHVLETAIRLYESLGFQHIPPDRVKPSPYARSDVQMELLL